MLVDYDNKKLFEPVDGKSDDEIRFALQNKPGRENVRRAIIDMSDSYKSFIKEFFPTQKSPLINSTSFASSPPHLNRRRKEITGDKRTNPVRRLLLRNHNNLQFFERSALRKWLDQCPEVSELYTSAGQPSPASIKICRINWLAEPKLTK